MTGTPPSRTLHEEDRAAVDHALARLLEVDGLTDPRVSLRESRYFSRLYGVDGEGRSSPARYVLKIGRAGRSCHEEFDQYRMLRARGIRTLDAVICSESHNYLVTRWEKLRTFDRHLANLDHAARRKEFRRLGAVFSELDARTGHDARFRADSYRDYVFPRLAALDSLSGERKREIERRCASLATALDGAAARHCFLSDFSLGNIHIDSEGELVLVDHGDATVGDSTSNVAYVYLSIRFGPPNIHFSSRRKVEAYFREFLRGYDDRTPNEELFALYATLHLINMLSFMESQRPEPSRKPRTILSFASATYLLARYRTYLLRLVRKIDVR